MTQNLAGASALEQELYDLVSSHAANEGAALRAYEELAESTDSEVFQFLAQMILRDERRHHEMLRDLAKTIQVSAEFSPEAPPVPYLDLHKDREAILAATEQLLAVEKEDQKELKRLARELKHRWGPPLWLLMIEIMKADNAKHRMILEFIHARVRPLKRSHQYT